MNIIAFMLNLPWTILGLTAAIVSGPRSLQSVRKPFAVLIHVQSFWWKTYLLRHKGVRATTAGNVVLLGIHVLPKDKAHELVHVVQYQRRPLVFPFLYVLESRRHGYRKNKYETEAYEKAQNRYKK
jgi:hypothetical protein